MGSVGSVMKGVKSCKTRKTSPLPRGGGFEHMELFRWFLCKIFISLTPELGPVRRARSVRAYVCTCECCTPNRGFPSGSIDVRIQSSALCSHTDRYDSDSALSNRLSKVLCFVGAVRRIVKDITQAVSFVCSRVRVCSCQLINRLNSVFAIEPQIPLASKCVGSDLGARTCTNIYVTVCYEAAGPDHSATPGGKVVHCCEWFATTQRTINV